MNPVWIGLGSNVPDPAAWLSAAVQKLGQAGLVPVRVSHLYETRPVGTGFGANFLNAVLQSESSQTPQEILAVLQAIETEMGRPDVGDPDRDGDRVVDLDLLAVGETVLETEELTLPHPRMSERAFVLVPLCEIDPHWRHPVLGRSAAALLTNLQVGPGDVRLYGPFTGEDGLTCSEYPWRHLPANREPV